MSLFSAGTGNTVPRKWFLGKTYTQKENLQGLGHDFKGKKSIAVVITGHTLNCLELFKLKLVIVVVFFL